MLKARPARKNPRQRAADGSDEVRLGGDKAPLCGFGWPLLICQAMIQEQDLPPCPVLLAVGGWLEARGCRL
jgi:hypothetical protein